MVTERSGVMLAKSIILPPLDSPLIAKADFILQPKLNGERAIWTGNKLLSSYGNEFSIQVPRVLEDLKSLCAGIKLDGELYKHGVSREVIHSAVSTTRKRYKANEVEYHIFDMITNLPQHIRLADLVISVKDTTALHKVATYYVKKGDEYGSIIMRILDEGYEGVIFRNPSGMYVAKRSGDLLKWKLSIKEAYKIVACHEGTGWAEGMLGSFKIELKNGKYTNVGTGFTQEQRKKFWRQRDLLVGCKVEVRHELLSTDKGIPLCCRFNRLV